MTHNVVPSHPQASIYLKKKKLEMMFHVFSWSNLGLKDLSLPKKQQHLFCFFDIAK